MVGRKRLPVKLCCQNKIYSRLPEDEVQLSLFKSKLWSGFNIETSEFFKSMISEFLLITKRKKKKKEKTFLENSNSKFRIWFLDPGRTVEQEYFFLNNQQEIAMYF